MMKFSFSRIIFLLVFLNFLFLPNLAFATRMPGVFDYMALIGLVGLAAGFIFAFTAVLIHYSAAKKKLTSKRYFFMWGIIFIGTPVALLVLFFIIILIAKL